MNKCPCCGQIITPSSEPDLSYDEFISRLNPPMSYHEMRKQRFKDFCSGLFTKWKSKEKP